jgi:nicotinate-nucleotide adenylyltransferase
MAVGILGGAFDPPHNGHVALARRAIEQLRLDGLVVRVVAHPGHKHVQTPPEDRLALTRLAFAALPEVEVSLDPFAWTVDSLETMALEDPVFIVGADELASFLTWKEPARVLELARLGVATRPGFVREELASVIRELPRPERVELFELEPLPISSSEIRDRVSRDEPIAELVSPAVAEEIKRRGLYRPRAWLH